MKIVRKEKTTIEQYWDLDPCCKWLKSMDARVLKEEASAPTVFIPVADPVGIRVDFCPRCGEKVKIIEQ